ncbi:MAG: acyl-CoA desaturase [Flavobacteriales bacterium]|nr:MAG: acyl-CoA desaturase [Flavobacteriales bacterium]
MASKPIKFTIKGNDFFNELRVQVDDYFSSRKLSKNGDMRLWIKTAFALIATPLMVLFALNIPYIGVPMPIWGSVFLFILVGQMHAFTGFNVMHDACHGAFSSRGWVNKLFGNSLSLMGSHAFIWKFKHNTLHHTFTNIDGLDDDIAKAPVLRHCASQEFKSFHKNQHIYMFFLYAISVMFWVFGNDIVKYFRKAVNEQPMPKMNLEEHIIFWVSKVTYTLVYIVAPIHFLGWGWGISCYLIMQFSLGVMLSLVFQMAHAVENVHFEDATQYDVSKDRIPNEWAIHQVITTNNFATNSPFATWFMGGLNFQVEHHLFPSTSHVHYPELNKILKPLCVKFNVDYHEIPTFGKAVASHIRYMKMLGEAV